MRAARVLALGLAAVLALPAVAAARSAVIDRFAVALDVGADGTLQVRESLTLDFRGAHRGLWRAIPVRYVRHGAEFALRVDGIAVLDEHHRPLRAEVVHRARSLRIKVWVPGAVDARRTVHVLYRVRRALLAFDDHDELYWNVTGDEWDVPIRHAEVTVTLPGGLAGAADVVAYTGARGATAADAEIVREAAALTVRATRVLQPREGLTVAVGWPPGAVARPSAARQVWWFAVDNWPLVLPLATLVLVGLLWRAYGRDPATRRSIKPEYGPPPGLVPAEAGPLLDQRAEPRDVVATLLDLAVRGHLAIGGVPEDPDDFVFRRVTALDEAGLKPLELTILRRIFGDQLTLRERRLTELRHDYDYVFPRLRDAIYRTLVADGLYAASPYWIRQGWLWAGGLVLTLAAALAASLERVGAGWVLPVGVALSGGVVLAFAPLMPRRTWRGARLLDQLRGFQEFLERAEKDRLERLPHDTLHRLLPWAMALGVSDRWILNWEGIDVPAPAWFDSGAPFSVRRFQRDLARFARGNERALLTSRAGGGGGAAGGASGVRRGSSGGGFGGGGGGTF